MTTAFARVGFPVTTAALFLCPNLWVQQKARQLYFLSERVSAEQALDLGLTNWVCDADELAAKTKEIAGQLAAGPTVAFRYMKENFARALSSGDVDDCLDLEATHTMFTVARQKITATLQKPLLKKREPVFRVVSFRCGSRRCG